MRERLLPDHLKWLNEHRQQVLIAGSLRADGSEVAIGACWIVEAEKTSDVEALFQSDPFWTGGLHARFEILRWSKAFPERKAMI